MGSTIFEIHTVHADTAIQFASSPNPVGSGARAIGMGGAFIAIADDATAASWNPGGLFQVGGMEFSIVNYSFHRLENIAPGEISGIEGHETISKNQWNYFSFSYPFSLFDRYMVISLNKQHLFDFNRKWDFSYFIKDKTDPINQVEFHADINYDQKGSLSAIGLAYSVQIIKQLAFGFTLNFWDDDLCHNKWTEKSSVSNGYAQMTIPEMPTPIIFPLEDTISKDEYTFDGFNINIGVLLKPFQNPLRIGIVYKSSVKGDLYHQQTEDKITRQMQKEMKLPMSFGLGLSYEFSDAFRVSADFYQTNWQDFSITDTNGNQFSPITKKALNASDINATHQVRMGAEYLLINKEKNTIIPVRAGIFYDPGPSENTPDHYFGYTVGSGIAFGKYIFDMAFQHRIGNNVGDSMVQGYDFSMDVSEYMVFGSLIVYL